MMSGSRPLAADATPGTATIVFTDLVSSTALRSSLGEERADELRRIHDQLLSEAVDAQHGQVVKGGGDGIMATFGAASDAVAAAVAMQQAMARYNRRTDRLAELSVRIGLSVGDVTWEGGDCFGTPVVEAARLQALADGGQILCSEFVRIMARGRGGHTFETLGFRELKGIPEPVPVCAIAWSDRDVARVALHPSLARPPRFPFVGRESERVAAEQFVRGGRGTRLLWVGGEPGIGKTRLVSELARSLHDDGWTVLFGHAEPDVAVPYRPVIEVLRAVAEGSTDVELASRLGPGLSELTRLLPELAARLGVAAPGDADGEAGGISHYRLVEAVRLALGALAAEAPLFVVFDDVHWAGPSVFRLLSHLLQEPLANGPAIALTYRDGEAPLDLRRLIDDAVDAPERSFSTVLSALAADDVATLVASSGEAEPVDAAEVHRLAAGNPFYVTALLRGPGRGAVGPAVRRRLSQLDESTQQALRVAAMVGLEFRLDVVGGVIGAGALSLLDQLETAARIGVVEESGAGRFRFAHALLRDELRSDLGPTRQVAVHRQIAEATERAAGTSLDEMASSIASHWMAVAATDPSARAAALAWAERAARQAARQLAYDDAARLFTNATDLLDQLGQHGTERWCQLRLDTANALRIGGHVQDAIIAARAACQTAIQLKDYELAGEAAELWSYAQWTEGTRSLAALRTFAGILQHVTATEAPAMRARLLANLALLHGGFGQQEAADACFDEALALADTMRTPSGWAILCGAATVVARQPARLSLRLSVARRTRQAIASGTPTDWAIIQVGHIIATLTEAEETAEAHAALHELELYADTNRDPLALSFFRSGASTLSFLAADLSAAESHAEIAADAIGRLRAGDTATYGVQMFAIRREQDRLGEILPALRLLAKGDPEEAWRPGLAIAYAEAAMMEEAAQQLEAMVSPEGVGLPEDSRFGLSCAYLAEVCCVVGDRSRAGALQAALAPYGPTSILLSGASCLGPATRHLGMLALLTEDWEQAHRALSDALARCQRMGAPIWEAHCHLELARVASMSGDGPASDRHLANARRLASEFGLARVARRCREWA